MAQTLIIPLGDSRDIILDLKDASGVRQSLAGMTVTFVVYKGRGRGTPQITKTATIDGSNLFATATITAGDLTVRGSFLGVAVFASAGKQYSVLTDLIVE